MLGVLCGFAAEAAVARPLSSLVACSGAIEENAYAQAEKLVANGATALLSFGVAGGLKAGLTSDALLVPESVVASGDRRWSCDATLRARLKAAVLHAQEGSVYGSRHLVPTPGEKKKIFAETGCAIVDMESHVIADVASKHRLPFAVLRGVSDAIDDTFPEAALRGLKLDGSTDYGAVLWSLAKNPFQYPALKKLFHHTGVALGKLGGAVQAFR